VLEQPTPTEPASVATTNPTLRIAVNSMSEGITSQSWLDELQSNAVAATFKGSTLVLSAGYLSWALRAGSLLATVAATMPTWAGFDPLPVLATKKRDAKKDEEQDETDTSKTSDWNEQRLAPLLDKVKPYNGGDASVVLDDIVIAGADTNPAQTITATMTVTDTATGSLTAASGNGETYTTGTGMWTVTGTRANVSAALAAVTFTPLVTDDVDTTVTIHVEDGDGARPLDAAIKLKVTPVNDAPMATNLATKSNDPN
jgi:hypothetical protein